MRLIDTITSNRPFSTPATGNVGIGVAWWPLSGDGRGSVRDEFTNTPNGHGDGTHGTKGGNGHCIHKEWHEMGGVGVVLTLLDAWRDL